MTKPDARTQRVLAEADALMLALDRVREGLVQRGLWPRDDDANAASNPEPYVKGDTLIQIARSVWFKGSTRPRREEPEAP